MPLSEDVPWTVPWVVLGGSLVVGGLGICGERGFFAKLSTLPDWELTYPPEKFHFESMIFLFPFGGIG